MASAMASAAARNIPPYTIPVGPRIRPPRLLPGTKAANTDPQPSEPPPTKGDVWVQGNWRKPGSNAARDRREVQSAKVEKALRHAGHGMNIYAYSHMRTHQVVYSLSRVMQNNKILPQLLNHGKQTIPSSLRRDMWRPYFSIHFPETPAGAEAGLKAYRRLRELSVQRQLSPPSELLIATKADVQKAREKYIPAEMRNKLEKQNLKNIPIQNQLLPKKLRAKKLMNQKATSVADAAFVLSLINGQSSPAEEQEAVVQKRAERFEQLSSRAARRLNRIREREAEKDAQIEARQSNITPTEGQLGLTPHAARRIALEYAGSVSAPWKGLEYSVHNPEAIQRQQEATNEYIQSTITADASLAGVERPEEFDAQKFRSTYVENWKEAHGGSTDGPPSEEVETAIKQEQEKADTQMASYKERADAALVAFTDSQQKRNKSSRTVQVLWADLRDATYAEQWSSNIYHGELESRAALKHERTLARRHADIDEEGNTVPGKFEKIVVQGTTTPHVFGVADQTGWYQKPEEMNKIRQTWRETKMRDWQESKLEKSKEVLDSMDTLHQQQQELLKKRSELQPEFDALTKFEEHLESSQILDKTNATAEDVTIQNLTDAEKYDLRTSMAAIEDNIAQNSNELTQMEMDYPSLYDKMSNLTDWRQNQNSYSSLLKLENEINGLQSAFEDIDPSASEQLQRIDQSLALTHSDLSHLISFESDLVARVTGYRQKIARLEEQISTLKASDQTDEVSDMLYDAQKSLQNQRNLLSSDRARVWEERLSSISSTLQNLEEDPSYKSTGIIDLLRQRVYAEQQGNTEQVESLDQDLKAREEDKLIELLGLDGVKGKKAQVTEYDEQMREKGLEMPAEAMPKQEKKSVWGRVKGLFGR